MKEDLSQDTADKAAKMFSSSSSRSSSSSESSWELVTSDDNKKRHQSSLTTQNKGIISGQSKAEDDDDKGAVTKDEIAKFRSVFASDFQAQVAQNACQETSVYRMTKNRSLIQKDPFTFSHCIAKSDLKVTDQQSSGRCWLFAFLNFLRLTACETLDVDEFEFSEAYLHFFDKLEKANSFLENIMETSQLSLDDRVLEVLLDDPIGDGGEWQMAASLAVKYGLVPKFAYPECHTSQSTDNMNAVLEQLLIFSAHQIRNMLSAGACKQQVQAYKNSRLEAVFRVLSIHLGTPPTAFAWQWRDKSGTFYRRQGPMTPVDFARFILDESSSCEFFDSYVCLVHDPRNLYYQNYTSRFAQTVVDGRYKVQFLNVPIEEMKAINQQMLVDGQAVWFACNVGQEFAEKPGLWDRNLYSLDSLYGVELGQLSKEDRIHLGYPMGTHAMLMTGVDVMNDGKPRRWKVENSWGTDGGHDGYYTMNDNWYDDNVFEIVCPVQYLTDEMKAGLATEPIVLPAWDPMLRKSLSKSRR